MHPNINNFTSDNFYEGRLLINKENSNRSIEYKSDSIIKSEGIHTILMKHEDRSQTSIEEFETIDKLMKQLIARQGKNSSKVVAVGDGNNDVRMISESGVGISFKGSDHLNLSAKHVLKNSDISAILYLLGLREEQFVY